MKTIFPAISYLLAVISTIILTIGPMAHSRGTIKLASDRDNIGFLRRYSSTGEAGITASAGIGNDEYTVLLLHMDGTDASNAFPDSSTGGAGSPHTVTANGNAQIDTAQSKFGGASGLFDGTDDRLVLPDSDDWSFTGDFTIDAWIKSDSYSSTFSIMGHYEDENNYWVVQWSSAYGLKFRWETSGTVTEVKQGSTSGWSTDTWYHFAVVRSGSTWYLYRDGTQIHTETQATDINNYSGSLSIGNYIPGSGGIDGSVDELRISKGIARWTSNFTPPSSPYGP